MTLLLYAKFYNIVNRKCKKYENGKKYYIFNIIDSVSHIRWICGIYFWQGVLGGGLK